MPETHPIIDTEGVRLEDIPDSEKPVYSIAKAIEYMQKPENAARIEAFAERLGEAQDAFMHKLDVEVSKVGSLLIDMGSDDSVMDSVINDFLGSFIKD